MGSVKYKCLLFSDGKNTTVAIKVGEKKDVSITQFLRSFNYSETEKQYRFATLTPCSSRMKERKGEYHPP